MLPETVKQEPEDTVVNEGHRLDPFLPQVPKPTVCPGCLSFLSIGLAFVCLC